MLTRERNPRFFWFSTGAVLLLLILWLGSTPQKKTTEQITRDVVQEMCGETDAIIRQEILDGYQDRIDRQRREIIARDYVIRKQELMGR